MSISEKIFRRLFAKTMYKNLKLSLGEMTFTKDFVNNTQGDLYPVIGKSGDCKESIEHNQYHLASGQIERVMGAFFPYASYEVTFSRTKGSCGFVFYIPEGSAEITFDGQNLSFAAGEKREVFAHTIHEAVVTMVVSLRPGYFDVYFVDNGKPEHIQTFASEIFTFAHHQKSFEHGYVSLKISGCADVEHASYYIDSGVSQADIRPIRYENGQIMVEQGKVYLTMSIRMQAEMCQGIFAWTPSTDRFELTGALFYDSGDGLWCGDVAASVLYHRDEKRWLLWVCAFSHGHILGHASFEGDPRFGVNVVDIVLMEPASQENAITDFVGFNGDEDPDFYYNEEDNKWYMAICRVDRAINSYRYYFFVSDEPFEGYTCIGQGLDGAETGGSFQKIDGERIFACGNDFYKTSNYRIYTKAGMIEAKFDFPDGGFRGWGTLIPVKIGSRERIFWLTFDRHKGSEYNWSYGNVYGFEAVTLP